MTGLFYDFSAHALDRLRQDDPLGLFHHALLQYLRCVAGQYLDGFLGDDLAPVGDLVDIVNGSAGDLDAFLERGLMNAQSVITLAAEGWDQRRMNVEDPLRPARGEISRQDRHKARKDDQVNRVLVQSLDHSGLESLL